MLLALFATLAPATLPMLAPLQDAPPELAADETTEMPAEVVEIMQAMAAMDWQEGTVMVEGDIATIALPEGWSYLQTMDAQFMVEKVWGNPPDRSVLGFISPPGEETWGVIVTFDEEGYVEDDDAEDMDFGDLLEEMQGDTEASNEFRAAEGYGTVDLVGWAEEPHYDSNAKKLFWAKRLRFSGEDEDTLNYNVRILGRHGVLVMNAVASIDELDAVHAGSKLLLESTEFTEGNRYQDFDSTMDKVAVYGIGGLIAGKVLLKAGILAKFGKLILVGVVGLFAAARRMFTGKKDGERPKRAA